MMGEKLAFQKKNGQKIAGKAYFAGVDKKYPTVIFAHGFGSNYRDLEHHIGLISKNECSRNWI